MNLKIHQLYGEADSPVACGLFFPPQIISPLSLLLITGSSAAWAFENGARSFS